MTDFNKQQPGRGKVLNPPHENAFSARTEADIFLLNQPTEPKSKVGTTKKFWCVLKLLKKKNTQKTKQLTGRKNKVSDVFIQRFSKEIKQKKLTIWSNVQFKNVFWRLTSPRKENYRVILNRGCFPNLTQTNMALSSDIPSSRRPLPYWLSYQLSVLTNGKNIK